jgi:phenylalanyl-tRNA synthetase alpha chain
MAGASSEDLKKRIDAIVEQARRELPERRHLDALDQERVRFLGRNGLLAGVFDAMRSLQADQRRDVGARANAAKQEIKTLIEQQETIAREQALGLTLRQREDMTLPPRRVRVGRLHPITQTMREVSRIFAMLGFETVEGPEIEWDYYNFEALNIPPGHPAREKWQTLWISNPLGDDPSRPILGRTHTSPMQIRVMEKRRPPIRVVIPGRCYRYEATDAIRESIFFQYEGLAIDEKLTMADLKGVLFSFARQVFGGDRKVRFRPDYFPFTEPSAEIAFDCFACEGRDPLCRTCGGSGWIEAAGCGMVHPDVLRRVGYDPSRYQGFAFGGGIERLAMLRTGAPDIRLFYQNDLRYLEQF